jgi:hypothetical protein
MQEWLDFDSKAYITAAPNVLSLQKNINHINHINHINNINVNNINIGVFHTYITYKGKEAIEYLVKTFPDVNFYITGVNIPMYKETEFFTYIEKYHIHGLLQLNKWGETYCYSLTKALMSGLPILYNNFGAFKERIPLLEKYIVNCMNENDYKNTTLLNTNFKKLLTYIDNNQDSYTTKEYDFKFKLNTLFDTLFG